MDLVITYRGGDDSTTERRISNIQVVDNRSLVAFCHLRNADRTFLFERIQSAIDPSTGEVVPDIFHLFNIPRPIVPARFAPTRTEPPATSELADLQRKKDRRDLFKSFRLEVLKMLAKKQLFDLFSNACFNCGSCCDLEMDHHIPQELGGRLVPGNIVVLCSRCNGLKLDRAPETFYSQRHLAALQPFLDAEHALFAFQFDYRAWDKDREQYLAILGVPRELIASVLKDENHPMYVGRDDAAISFTITAGPTTKEQGDS